MLALVPVIELQAPPAAAGWPVSVADGRWLHLSGRMSSQEVGLAMATICTSNLASEDDWPAERDASATLLRLVEDRQERGGLIVPGGLRLSDPSRGVTVDPGCCCGLESWRDWHEVTAGSSPWLGHSPEPWIEHREDGTIRVWPDKQSMQNGDGDPAHLDLATADLAGLLSQAQHDLTGFLTQVEQWASVVAPDLSSAVTEVLDEDLSISRSGA